eukprot:1371779-Rhodomonas_salina.8
MEEDWDVGPSSQSQAYPPAHYCGFQSLTCFSLAGDLLHQGVNTFPETGLPAMLHNGLKVPKHNRDALTLACFQTTLD